MIHVGPTLTQCTKKSDKFRLNNFISSVHCKTIKYSYRAISKNVNNNTQSEEVAFKLSYDITG